MLVKVYIVIDYSKCKLAALFVNADAYIISPALIVLTNVSKVVRIPKSIHGSALFVFECIKDSSNLAFLPIDLAIFKQPIPVGFSNRFNLFNKTDFLDFEN